MKRFLVPLLAVLICLVAPSGSFAETKPAEDFPDLLIYANGDRLQGRLVSQSAGVIVFRSIHCGELRLSATEVKLAKADLPPSSTRPPNAPLPSAAMAAATPPAPNATAKAPATQPPPAVRSWDQLLPLLIAQKLHAFFGAWHGRFSFSTEAAVDTSDRKNLAADFQLQRKWKADEVQIREHFEDNSVNDVTTSNRLKTEGSWRHDFSSRWFAQYRPTLEWNRASIIANAFSSYVLMQHDLGVGLTLLSNDVRKVRVGLAQDYFDNWNTALQNVHTSRGVDSSFVEAELKMPWQLTLSQRAVYYYSLTSQQTGWESRLELSKKLTETISTAIQHELRREVPDGRTPDYTYLRVLLGLDF